MKNVLSVAQLEGETHETSIDARRRKYYPKYVIKPRYSSRTKYVGATSYNIV